MMEYGGIGDQNSGKSIRKDLNKIHLYIKYGALD